MGKSLDEADLLFIEEEFEPFELLRFIGIPIQTRNRFTILNELKQPVAFGTEQSQGLIIDALRQFLWYWIPFEILINAADGAPLYRVESSVNFWLQRVVSVRDMQGALVGTVVQRWSLFYLKFELLDADSRKLGQSKTWNKHFFRVFRSNWEFDILSNRRLATVHKIWRGIPMELFTDDDSFAVTYHEKDLRPQLRLLILASCFLLNTSRFEQQSDD